MRLRIIYRKNLKMSEGKIAAQAVHASMGLGTKDYNMNVVVLGVSDKKFNEIVSTEDCFTVHDLGHTEVDKGTITCAAYYGA